MRIGKGEPIVHRFLRTDIAKTSLIFFIKMLIPLPGVKSFLGENRIWWVSYFVKTKPYKYHKIMIFAQHWSKQPSPLVEVHNLIKFDLLKSHVFFVV